MSMSYGNDFRAISGFPKHDKVWEPPKHNPPRSEFVFSELPWVLANPLDRPVQLIQEQFRSPPAALLVASGCRLSFFQSGG